MSKPIYFANPTRAANQAMIDGELGFIDTPAQGNKRPAGVMWVADNGKFSKKRALEGKPWDEAGWWRFLEKNAYAADDAVFVTAPDVVNWIPTPDGTDMMPIGDAAATLIESARWYDKIHALGFKVALVAQDGLDPDDVPWDKIDAIFIGGSDDYKVGTAPNGRKRALKLDGTSLGTPGSLGIMAAAKEHGKWLHIGRVNTRARLRFAEAMGADSVDGTFLTFGPDENLPKLLDWLHEPATQTDYALAA